MSWGADERLLEGETLLNGAVSPDGRTTVLVRNDGSADVFGVDDVFIGRIRGHNHAIVSVNYVEDGSSILTVDSAGGTISTRLDGLSRRERLHAEDEVAMVENTFRRFTGGPARHVWSLLWRSSSGAGTVAGGRGEAPRLPTGMPAPVGTIFRDCAGCPEMVTIPSPPDTEGPWAVAMGRFEVTSGEWSQCEADLACPRHETSQPAARMPVVQVSWQDARSFVDWLSTKTDEQYRLLTDVEWEFAARANTTSAFSFGEGIHESQARFRETPASTVAGPIVAGSFPTNSFGLFDMHGNVSEWVEDCVESPVAAFDAASPGPQPTGDDGCAARVHRGGSWMDGADALRSDAKRSDPPSTRSDARGFRVARNVRTL